MRNSVFGGNIHHLNKKKKMSESNDDSINEAGQSLISNS